MRMVNGLLVLAAAWLLAGCDNLLAARMVRPPNGQVTAPGVKVRPDEKEQRVLVGTPPAELSYWVLEPKMPVRGTVLLLHGFVADHHQLEGPAKALQKAGYRAVLVDLRGHGRSTGDHITFGVEDAVDLRQLTDHLQKEHLCGASVGVYGTSYGAATALLFAGSDPRVKAVVAVAPFASLREEAPYFGKYVLALPGRFLTAADYVKVVDRMGKLAGFDPDACSPLAAIQKTTAHVRLFHGTSDLIVSSHASEELAAAAPGRTELTLVPGKGHLSLVLDLLGELRPQTREWFDTYLATKPEKAVAAVH